MPAKRPPSPPKPFVFLSHASANHRELRSLKDFLNKRAAGMVEFFLSSDHESIPPGSLWSAEVKAALDRMNLILIFASKEALESRWTYFEAGYGLHVTGRAAIYCLRGCSRDSLPSPFSILQNRNLHSAQDLSLLIAHCNKELGASMEEKVSKAEFDALFPPPLRQTVQAMPPLTDLVSEFLLECGGSGDSVGKFFNAAQENGHYAHSTKVNQDRTVRDEMIYQEHDVGCACPGLSLVLTIPNRGRPIPVKKIETLIKAAQTKKQATVDLPKKFVEVLRKIENPENGLDAFKRVYPGWDWMLNLEQEIFYSYGNVPVPVTLPDALVLLQTVHSINTFIDEWNKMLWHNCLFKFAPEGFSIGTQVFDSWRKFEADAVESFEIKLKLASKYRFETRPERIGAALMDSGIVLRMLGVLQWKQDYDFELDPNDSGGCELHGATNASLGEMDLPGFLNILWDRGLILKVK